VGPLLLCVSRADERLAALAAGLGRAVPDPLAVVGTGAGAGVDRRAHDRRRHAAEPVHARRPRALAAPLAANDRRQDYMRARVLRARDGAATVEAFDRQDSSMLSLLARADCLIVRPPHAPAAAAGDLVDVLPFPPGLVGF